MKRLYEAKKRIRALIKFIDWLMQMPLELESQLEEEIGDEIGGKTMPYITSWERIAMKRGMEKGIEQGIEKGLEKAKIEDARRMLEKSLDDHLILDITGLPEEKLARIKEELDKKTEDS